MSKNTTSSFRRDFDYEEDDYDRLKHISQNNSPYKGYGKTATIKKGEFDYEEDHYEPEKNR